jgi:FtsH-binding integral membrane protein
MGVSAAPIFLVIQDVSTTILPLTMGITGAIFGGSSLVGLALPKGSMLGYGPIFLGGLFGLIGLNVAGILAAKYMAFPLFATLLASA